MEINAYLWGILAVVYFILDGIGAKNIIATNKLDRFTAANTSAGMYLFGVIGSYVCVKEGLINIIPILVGAWLGTFFAVSCEIKLKKKNGNSNLRTQRQKSKSKGVV